MAAKKKKPKFEEEVYAYLEGDDGGVGWESFYTGTDHGDTMCDGETRTVAVYKLAGFITVQKSMPMPPAVTVGKMRSKP